MTNGIVLNLTVGLWSAIVLSVTAVVIYGIRAFVRLATAHQPGPR